MILRLKAWIESLSFVDDRRVWWHYEDWRPWSIGIELASGGLRPLGYGVAWRCPCRLAHRCYPVPLNLVLASLRSLWCWASHTTVPNRLDIERARGYAMGRSDGYDKACETYRGRVDALRDALEARDRRIADLNALLLQHRKIEEAFERTRERLGVEPGDDEWPNEPYERQIP